MVVISLSFQFRYPATGRSVRKRFPEFHNHEWYRKGISSQGTEGMP